MLFSCIVQINPRMIFRSQQKIHYHLACRGVASSFQYAVMPDPEDWTDKAPEVTVTDRSLGLPRTLATAGNGKSSKLRIRSGGGTRTSIVPLENSWLIVQRAP
jgi:hypothetical protein